MNYKPWLVLGASLLGISTRLSAQQGVDKAIAEFKKADPGITKFLSSAEGYVVFPSVGKGAMGIGGAHGGGYVYDQGRLIGRSTLTQVTIGFQLGGQAYREIILFKDRRALDDFTRGNFQLSAQASAVA